MPHLAQKKQHTSWEVGQNGKGVPTSASLGQWIDDSDDTLINFRAIT